MDDFCIHQSLMEEVYSASSLDQQYNVKDRYNSFHQLRIHSISSTLGWLDSLVAKALDWWLSGREFDPRPLHCQVTTWSSCSHQFSSVIKQYNLVPADRQWRSSARKVTAVLAESNGSLPSGGWLNATCRLTACTPGSAPSQRSVMCIGEPFYLLRYTVLHNCSIKSKSIRYL